MDQRWLFVFSAALLTQTACSQQASVASRARAFLQSLSEEQIKKARYPFDHEERYNWHFIPRKDRKGIELNDLTSQQREAGFEILRGHLSDSGYRKSLEIIRLESLLQELENRKAGDWYRDPGRYTFLFFGEPSDSTRWGWRFEGHHISFTFSSINGKLRSGTPGFLGSNPAVVLSGPQKGQEVLQAETALGFRLLHALSPEQQRLAQCGTAVPGDIITGNSRKVSLSRPEGLSFGRCTKEQQTIFLQLLSLYINHYTPRLAADLMQEVEEAGLDSLYFRWCGSTVRSRVGWYYRIHGPTLLIEYDNTQNDANHVHTVIRDLKHDFGDDLLANHYGEDHR